MDLRVQIQNINLLPLKLYLIYNGCTLDNLFCSKAKYMSKSLKYSIISVFIFAILLFVIPFLIPIDDYKAIIITEVKKATGRDLIIDGKIKLAFLPIPTVTLEKVKLSSLPEAMEPILLDIENVTVSLSISPLLYGKLVISNIELSKPIVKLEKLKDGTGTWEFSKTTHEPKSLVAAEHIDKNTENSPPFYVEKIKIKNGQIEYRDGTNNTIIGDVSIELGLEKFTGPINFAVNLRAFEQDVKINGKIKELAEIIPIEATIKIGVANFKVSGEFDRNKVLLISNIESQDILKNLGSIFSNQQIIKDNLQTYKLIIPIIANKEKIEIRDLNIKVGKAEIKGQAVYDIVKNIANLNLNLDPSNMAINVDLSKYKDGFLGKIDIKASAISSLLEAVSIEANISKSLNQKFSITLNSNYKDDEISLDNISASLGNANLNGMIKLTQLSKKPIISYDLRTDNGSALIAVFKDNLPVSLSDLRVKGTTTKDQNLLNTNTTISVAKADINLNGKLNIGDVIKPSMLIAVSGNNLNQTLRQLLNKNSSIPISSFAISTMVEGDLSKSLNIKLNKSNIQLGADSTVFSGDANLILSGSKPQISANLQLASINLNNAINNNNISSSNESGQQPNINRNYWSDDKIDMSSLNSVDGNFNISIEKLIKGSLVFDSMKVKLRLSNGTMKLDSLTGHLYGGTLEGSGMISNKEVAFKSNLKGAKLKNIAPQDGRIKITQGIVDFNSNIRTIGTSLNQYMNNLSGDININGNDGCISGFNLQKVIDSLNNPKNLQTILGSFQSSFTSGETKFKNFNSTLIIKNGIGDLSECKLSADGASLNATGKINIPKYLIDVKSSIKIDINAMPPFNVYLTGPIDNPNRKFDFKNLQQHLIKNVLTGVIDNIKNGKTKPQDILKGVLNNLGNKKNNNPEQPNQGSENNKEKPKEQDPLNDLMKKGLKGLFK